MQEYYLKIESEVFKKLLSEQVNRGKKLLEIKSSNPFHPMETEIEYNQWHRDNQNLISTSFVNGAENYFFKDYNIPFKGMFKVPGIEPDLKAKNENILKNVRIRISLIENLIDIVEVGDYLKSNGEIKPNYSNKLSYKAKEELLLTKLYKLQGDRLYSIKEILLANGIVMVSDTEEYDLANYLEEKGFVENNSTKDGAFVRIIMSGIDYVENLGTKTIKESPSENGEMDKKLDLILEKLELLDTGHEVLFEEIEELRDLYGKLNKKNWIELLKGKLLDISISQLLDKDNIEFIYNTLTNGNLKLPHL